MLLGTTSSDVTFNDVTKTADGITSTISITPSIEPTIIYNSKLKNIRQTVLIIVCI